MLIVAMCSAVGAVLWRMRDDALADGRRAIAATGVAIAEQTLRAVQSADLVLQDLHQQMVGLAAAGPLRNNETLVQPAFWFSLRDRLRNLPQLDVLSVIDPQGHVLAFSRGWPTPAIMLADRDYFIYLRNHDDASTYVSVPVQNRGSLSWVFYLARRIDGPTGAFMGIVLAALPVAYFEDFFQRVSSGNGGTVALVRREGLLLAHYPRLQGAFGKPWPPMRGWEELVAAGGGQAVEPGNDRLPPRILSVHPLPLYPLVVDVTVTQTEVLATWRNTALLVAAGIAGAALGFAVLFRLLAVQFRALERQSVDIAVTAVALRRSQRLLRENAQRLETTLAHMDEGLIMVDAAGKIVVCNDRAVSLLGLPPALMAGEPSFEDVLKYQWETKEFEGTAPTLLEFFRAGAIPDAQHVYERTRPDGRTLEVRSIPLQGGGMVRTYTDITERHAAEELIRHQATHDDLTGLANRALFTAEMRTALEMSSRSARGLAVLCLDLDGFKLVNDTRGHPVGDKLLQAVAQRLLQQARSTDIVARLGGDEFAILQTLVDASNAAAVLAQRLVTAISIPYDVDGAVVEVGTSIGIALFPDDALTVDDLLTRADNALYEAKRNGRRTYRFFSAAAA